MFALFMKSNNKYIRIRNDLYAFFLDILMKIDKFKNIGLLGLNPRLKSADTAGRY